MLQWMGGSRRKVSTSRKSTQKRQKQYFEQRKRQHQLNNSSWQESYPDKKVPCIPCKENGRSLDILSLLNLSTDGQKCSSHFPEARGSSMPEHTTPKYQLEHCPNTIQVETKNLYLSEHVSSGKEVGTASNHQAKTVCPQEFSCDYSASSHSKASKRNSDKDEPKMATDHKLSVVDILGDDGKNCSSRGNLVHEDHVAFSVEGLGEVEMETPVHSPQQPTRTLPCRRPSPLAFPKGDRLSKKLYCRLQDHFPELDDMTGCVDIPNDASYLELPPYLGEIYGNSKQKITANKEFLVSDMNEFLSNDGYSHSRVEQDEYKWNEKSSFLDEKILGEECGLSWRNWPCDLGFSRENYMISGYCEKPDFSFESLHVQKRRTSGKAAGRFRDSEFCPYKHQKEHGYDFTTSDMTCYPTIGRNSEFSDMTSCSPWPSFATEDARNSFSLLSEESYLSSAVWHKTTKNPIFYSTREECKYQIDPQQQEIMTDAGTRNRTPDFSSPGDDWLFGEGFNRTIIPQKASTFGCKHQFEEQFGSDCNPKLYVDDNQSALRSKCDVFNANFSSEKISFGQQVNINVTCGQKESFGGLFKEENGFRKIQLREVVGTDGEEKSVTVAAISRKLDGEEDNCHQCNYSSSTSETPMTVLLSQDNHSHCDEPKVITPKMTSCLNVLLSPGRSEGASSSVEMPQKLEDCIVMKESQNGTQTSLQSQNGCNEIVGSEHGKGETKSEGSNSNVDPSCNVMVLNSFVLCLL